MIVAGEIWTREDGERALALGADMVAMGKSAIGMAEWPKLIQDPNFVPIRPPYSPEYLQNEGLGAKFIEYMKKWKGFVAE